jgi:hypothetical protein
MTILICAVIGLLSAGSINTLFPRGIESGIILMISNTFIGGLIGVLLS